MKILITGVTGFLGSHLASALVENGHTVIGLKRQKSDVFRLQSILKKIFTYDVEDGLEGLFSSHPDINLVLHAATCYGNNGELPSEVIAANVILPLRVLELVQCNENCVFINTDTYFAKTEDSYTYLADYVFSKAMFCCLGKRFAERNQCSFINLRLEHVFGPGDGSKKFTDHIIRQLIENKPFIKLTAGAQLRDFVFIDDVVAAYLVIINSDEVMTSKKFNSFEVGSGEPHSIKDFVLAASQIIKSKSVLEFGALPYRENELMHSEANLESLKKLGWNCKVSMELGIDKVVSSLVKSESL